MGAFFARWWKILLILVVFAVGWFTAFPSGDPRKPKIVLGLDLKGGSYLVLRVKTEDTLAGEANLLVEDLKVRMGEQKIAFGEVRAETKEVGSEGPTVVVAGVDAAGTDAFRDLIAKNYPTWIADFASDGARLRIEDNYALTVRDGAVRKALEIIEKRINEFGVAEPQVQRLGGTRNERIVLQLPGVGENEARRIKDIIKKTSFLEWKSLSVPEGRSHDDVGGFLDEAGVVAFFGGALPSDTEILPGTEKLPDGKKVLRYYPVKKAAVITGSQLQTARVEPDQFGQPEVGFTLNAEGTQRFGEFTSQHVGDRIAVVLDGTVQTAPTIQGAIFGPGRITGQYTLETAEDLALTLRSGALPAGIEVLEERTVGPSLGSDSIRQGIRAAVWGMVVLGIAALVWYSAAGINALVALALNALLLLAAMCALDATLTLPGIAGYILSIGMAVDSNVLIFERIKEELRVGRTLQPAIDAGFQKAFRAILDSNVTTIIAALFLFEFGTGPVRGFAVTLIIGLAASMFTAIFVSRALFEVFYVFRRAEGIRILPLLRVLRPVRA